MKEKKETHGEDRAGLSGVAESESSSLALHGWKKAEDALSWPVAGPAEKARCPGRATEVQLAHTD